MFLDIHLDKFLVYSKITFLFLKQSKANQSKSNYIVKTLSFLKPFLNKIINCFLLSFNIKPKLFTHLLSCSRVVITSKFNVDLIKF